MDVFYDKTENKPVNIRPYLQIFTILQVCTSIGKIQLFILLRKHRRKKKKVLKLLSLYVYYDPIYTLINMIS